MADKEPTNFYNPDDDEDSQDAPRRANADTVITWTASEFIEHQRGSSWYLLLVVITIAVAAGTFFITRDYVATAMVTIAGIILGFFVGHKPRQITYELSDYGLKVGDKALSFRDYKSFTISRDGALSSLTLFPLKRYSVPFSAYLETKDEDKVAELIGNHLPIEDHPPDRWDRVTRRLKI